MHASACTSSHGMPRTSVSRRSASRWRRNTRTRDFQAFARQFGFAARDVFDVAVVCELLEHPGDGRRRNAERGSQARRRDARAFALEPVDGLEILFDRLGEVAVARHPVCRFDAHRSSSAASRACIACLSRVSAKLASIALRTKRASTAGPARALDDGILRFDRRVEHGRIVGIDRNDASGAVECWRRRGCPDRRRR